MRKVKRVMMGILMAACMVPSLFGVAAGAAASPTESAETRMVEIRRAWSQMKPTYTGDLFETQPSARAPYAAGRLRSGAIRDVGNLLNFMRTLADLPTDVVMTEDNNAKCQHGAVCLAALGTITHDPKRPSDMPQDFFATAYDNCASSNVYYATGSSAKKMPWQTILSFMDDSDASNIDRLGHRRWILNPSMLESGIGFAEGKNGASYFGTLYAFDTSRSEEVAYDAICWPNGPAFPSEFFAGDHAWSVTLNPAIYQTPSRSAVAVTLSNDAGERWTFDADDTSRKGRYFNVNTDGFGVSNVIIFRPDGISDYRGVYTVTIDGLKQKDGTATTLQYSVAFFSLDNAEAPTITPSATRSGAKEEPVKDTSGKVYELKTGKYFRVAPTIEGKSFASKTLTWRSDDPAIVAVNATSGIFKTRAKGQAMLFYATPDKRYEGYIVVNVT